VLERVRGTEILRIVEQSVRDALQRVRAGKGGEKLAERYQSSAN